MSPYFSFKVHEFEDWSLRGGRDRKVSRPSLGVTDRDLK